MFCDRQAINSFSVSVNDIIEFLTEQFEEGLGYSAINTARSAISSLGITFAGFSAGTHPMVIRFMKGVYNLRPPVSRYTHIWDVDKVLTYLRKLSPVKALTLKDLTLKLTILMALVNTARCQTLHLLTVNKLQKLPSEFVLQLDSLIKQSRPGVCSSIFHLKAYPPDRRLCVYTVLKEYLHRTSKLRESNDSKLLISYCKPHKPVTKSTVARWIKVVMCRAGIDIKMFGPHSVRAASASKAKLMAVPIADIMKTAGWSNKQTFAKFYDKKIMPENKVSEAVLQL